MLFTLGVGAQAQSDLQKLVDTENAFARTAAEKNTRSAFLEFLADDSIVFAPQRSNGKQVWLGRKDSPALLSWYPVFADISGNGLIGYTTGPWEFRPKGKDDLPAAFGHYMTIWQKQTDGNFKAVLDIGVDHPGASTSGAKLITVAARNRMSTSVATNAGDAAASFFETITDQGVIKAYKEFAADDIRLMRSSKAPFVGKKAALKELSQSKNVLSISKRIAFYGTDDIAYCTNTYTLAKDGQKVESGNFVQIWKYRDGRWAIVMDVFVADPK
jgi:ketosteroid isomerase-like protein